MQTEEIKEIWVLQKCCPSKSESPLSITVGFHQDLEFAWIYGIPGLGSKQEVPQVPLPISAAGTYTPEGQQQVPYFLTEVNRRDATSSHPEGKNRSFQRQDSQHDATGVPSNNLGRASGAVIAQTRAKATGGLLII